MNILLLSVGTRNKVVQYFKESVGENGKVIATDMSDFAPAVYEADKFYKVPRIDDKNYIEVIVNICKKEKIDALLSLIDPELSLLAANKDKFDSIGAIVIGSSYELCERAMNKMSMCNWLSKYGYCFARSYLFKEDFYEDLNAGLISYPVVVKPVKGSASIAVSKVEDSETLEVLFSHNKNLMIQEYLNGQEIGVDVYIDMISGEVVSIFTKKKMLMKSGETDKAVSFKDEKLFELIKNFSIESGWRGPIDIDVFCVNGKYYISEVNPRFGGGYPHAHECGCNHVKMIVNNVKGVRNKKVIGQYRENAYMMKYNEVVIRNFSL